MSTLDGDPVPGGPLDHAGHWALDPADPSAGFIGFGVEVKNVRHTLYPSHREVWDLLAKMGAFPVRVPILITRRLHYWTYQMFSEIGAIAFQSERQWFSPTIDAGRFQRVTDMLGFRDAVRVADPDAPNRALSKWLTATVRKGTRGDARPLMQRQHERWQRAAPICAEYLGLRDDLDSEARHEVFAQFVEELREEGFDTSGFAPGDD